MNISIASEGTFTGDLGGPNILISPCYIPPEEPLKFEEGLKQDMPSHSEPKEKSYHTAGTSDISPDQPNLTIIEPTTGPVRTSPKQEEQSTKCDIHELSVNYKDNIVTTRHESTHGSNVSTPNEPALSPGSRANYEKTSMSLEKEERTSQTKLPDVYDKEGWEKTPATAAGNTVEEILGNSTSTEDKADTEDTANNFASDLPGSSSEVPITLNKGDHPQTINKVCRELPHHGNCTDIVNEMPEQQDDEQPQDDEQQTNSRFISSATFMQIVGRLNSKPLLNWVKLCKLKPAHTAELNKKILCNHFKQVSEKKCLLPPSIVENITKKLNDDAVCDELDALGLNRAKNARSRKNQLQTYLIENFTAINLADRLSDFKLEKSRISKKKKKKDRNRTSRSMVNTTTVTDKISTVSDKKDHCKPGSTEPPNRKVQSAEHKCMGEDGAAGEDLAGKTEEAEAGSEHPKKTQTTQPLENHESAKVRNEKPVKQKNLNTEQAATGQVKKSSKLPPKGAEPMLAPKNLELENLEKPLRTLEESFLKLQDATSQQKLRLDMLDANNKHPKCVDSDIRQELSDLRTKMDSILKTIEIQQNTLCELVEASSRTGQPTKKPASVQTEGKISGEPSTPSSNIPGGTVQDCKNCNCSAQISQIFCLLAIIWNQTEYLRKNSYPANIQKAAIDLDHTYCKTRHENLNLSQVDVNSDTIGEAVSSQPESTEPAIFLDEDLEVCESTDILSTDDYPDAPQPPKPIPVVKAKSSDTLTLPIREKTGSTSMPRKGKCLILHECPSISVNDEKLGPFFDLECIQIQSLKGVTSKKNLQRLSNRVMDIKPTVIFINLGKSDLRHLPTATVTQCYEKLLKSLINVTDADICATMLQQTCGYPKQNKPVAQFNAELSKLVKHMRTLKEPNGSTQIYIEDENYVSNGIGSKTELTEDFPFTAQPGCSDSTMSKTVLNGRNINTSIKAEPIPVVTRTIANRKGADNTITQNEVDTSASTHTGGGQWCSGRALGSESKD